MATALTPAERAMWEVRLEDARAKLHLVMTGGQARVFVDQSGERVEYGPANAKTLSAYILMIETKLGLCTVSGPLNVWF